MPTVAMKSGNFSHDGLVDQTVHFLTAPTETVAGSTACTIYLLSRHPGIQIRQKLPSTCPVNGRLDLSEANFSGMKYLDAVIKEVLRFHSINTILWRECVYPARLLGTAIPVGTEVTLSPWELDRIQSIGDQMRERSILRIDPTSKKNMVAATTSALSSHLTPAPEDASASSMPERRWAISLQGQLEDSSSWRWRHRRSRMKARRSAIRVL